MKKLLFSLSALIAIISLSVITASADSYTWDFEAYVIEQAFGSDTPISEASYTEFPSLTFNYNSSKPNTWNIYNKQYGIALYNKDGNFIKYTPNQNGTLSITAFYKKIDQNERWLSIDTQEPASSNTKIFDLQNDTAENKITTKQTRTIELTAGTTYYIHGNNIIFTAMKFEGNGDIVVIPTPTPAPIAVTKAEILNSDINYETSVNTEEDYDLYVAIYNSKGQLRGITKNELIGKFTAAEDDEYTLKSFLWKKGLMSPISMDETNIKDITLKDKTVYAFGDSIVYGHTDSSNAFMNLTAKNEGITLSKHAVNGATVIVDGTNDIITQLAKAPTKEPDFIVFDGYTNDAYEPVLDNLGIAQGKTAATFDNTTFRGAFEEIIYTMKQKWPNAKIVFVTIHKSAARDWDIQCKLREECINICKEWGVEVCDIFNDTTLDTRDSAQMTKYIIGGKGSHPNLAGCKEFYVPAITKKLKELCK